MNKESLDKIVEIDLDTAISIIIAKDTIEAILREKYIFKPLKEFAKTRQFDFELDESKCTTGFSKNEWNGKILICSGYQLKPNWQSMFIGISYGKEITPSSNLNCLHESSTAWWPYGIEHLPAPFNNLNSPTCYYAVKNGDVAKWIEGKVDEIVKEAENTKP